jgi:hypothetical protein
MNAAQQLVRKRLAETEAKKMNKGPKGLLWILFWICPWPRANS